MSRKKGVPVKNNIVQIYNIDPLLRQHFKSCCDRVIPLSIVECSLFELAMNNFIIDKEFKKRVYEIVDLKIRKE